MTDIGENDLFRAVAHPRRRRTILALSHLGDARIEHLAEVLASETDPEGLEVELYHNHLPILSEVGLVYMTGGLKVAVPTTTIDPVAGYLRDGFRRFGYDFGLDLKEVGE